MNAVISRYREEIAGGILSPDAGQEHAVNALQELYDAAVKAPSSRRKPGSKMILGSRLAKWIPASAGMTSEGKKHQGVYLYGPVGRGKSRMMDLFFAVLPAEIPKRRVHFHEFMLEVHAFLHQARQLGGKDGVDDVLPQFAAHVAKDARVLCFDEFHVIDVADAMLLSRLFTALFAAGVTVVMTSNWPPQDLYKNGLQRDLFLPFITLIKERMQIVAVDRGPDYRQARLAGQPVYFYPNNQSNAAILHSMFHDLTDEDHCGAVALNVLGHTLTIPRAGHGVAWASFSDLCEKALAAQDYLALAKRFHTVILDQVPRLTYDRRNETKRLMILVDILYEHKRRLIMLADASPDKLFVDNEHAFEFKRTLSRLSEMQSEQYLAQINEEFEPC